LFETEASEIQFIDKVVNINRVAKVVKGGRRFRFSAIVVVGDGQGKVGVGLGKAQEVPEAIRKALEKAKKEMIQVPILKNTIPYAVTGQFGSGRPPYHPLGRAGPLVPIACALPVSAYTPPRPGAHAFGRQQDRARSGRG